MGDEEQGSQRQLQFIFFIIRMCGCIISTMNLATDLTYLNYSRFVDSGVHSMYKIFLIIRPAFIAVVFLYFLTLRMQNYLKLCKSKKASV